MVKKSGPAPEKLVPPKAIPSTCTIFRGKFGYRNAIRRSKTTASKMKMAEIALIHIGIFLLFTLFFT